MYYKDIETDRKELAAYVTSQQANARARLDKVAAKKKLKKLAKKESQA